MTAAEYEWYLQNAPSVIADYEREKYEAQYETRDEAYEYRSYPEYAW